MNTVPFYRNRADNKSCMLAVYRSIFKYYTNKEWSWAELEELTGFKSGTTAWTIKALTELAKNDWDVKMFEPFDYSKYAEVGEAYLDEVLSPDEKDWQIKNSNIREIKQYIPEFLKAVNQAVKNADTKDIDSMLANERLVSVVLNSKHLNQKSGYVAHNILIFKDAGDSYIFHDPGLPGKPNRKELKSLVREAMGAFSEVTGFKLQ